MRYLRNCAYTKDPIFLGDALVLCSGGIYSYTGIITDRRIENYADHVIRYPEDYRKNHLRNQYSHKDMRFLKTKIPEWSKVIDKIIKGE